MFFDFKSRGTFTSRPSKKEKHCLKKGNYLKKKKNLYAIEILAEKSALFCARIPENGLMTSYKPQNSNPCRKISRFFCKDAQGCSDMQDLQGVNHENSENDEEKF